MAVEAFFEIPLALRLRHREVYAILSDYFRPGPGRMGRRPGAGAVTDKPLRLDLALIRRHPELSRRKAREVIEKGQVDVDGAAVARAGRARSRGTPTIRWDPQPQGAPRARSSLPLLYRDEWLVIVDKPAGLLSVPTSAESQHEDTALARVLRVRAPPRPRAAVRGARSTASTATRPARWRSRSARGPRARCATSSASTASSGGTSRSCRARRARTRGRSTRRSTKPTRAGAAASRGAASPAATP